MGEREGRVWGEI
uniref:Uncharacterized protein n=1 Tax=Arundo donax TaxID=35708 RepID=A0A0A9GB73_ARUDO